MNRPEHEPDRQVSELSAMEEVRRGGADSTDKSTGTAPHTANEPTGGAVAEADSDLISVIIADHRAVEKVFTELEVDESDPARRREMVDHVITELVRHSVAEEMYMYPAAREVLPDGDEIADHEIEEHQEAEQVLKELEGLEATDPQFEELLRQLMSDIRHHVQDEENDLLPKLQQACSAEQLEDLGKKVLRAKEMAPTRPHPSAPNKPPANKILGPGTAIVDRMRDALSSGTR